MTKLIDWLNDNHWYLVALGLIAGVMIWVYGCVSTVPSLLDPSKTVNRDGLAAEVQFLNTRAQAEVNDLNRQDATKQAVVDAFNTISTSGGINTTGILSLLGTIGAVAFGLQQRKLATSNGNNKPTSGTSQATTS
jgi:hypothetical protein